MLNLFTKQTLAGIMSGFTKTLDDLEVFAANRDKDAGALYDEISNLQIKRSDAQAEAAQAKVYANNIRSMLEGK